MSKMLFGQYIGSVIAGNSGCAMVKLGHYYFNMEAVQKAASCIDSLIITCQEEGRKLTPLENLMVDILIAQAGWNNLAAALESYSRYINTPEQE